MRFYQIDAFAARRFAGNPAGVCILEGEWPSDDVMQKIAGENALPETAFLQKGAGGFFIRWFAPLSEIYLCGHATLATGHAMFHHEGYEGQRLVMDSNRGPLAVEKNGERLTLDFPACELIPQAFEEKFAGCFEKDPCEVYIAGADYMFVYESEADIAGLRPDLGRIAALAPLEGIIATAPGDEVDFVSRVFAPAVGIDEDPVTGSAHTAFAPYWQKRLGKSRFAARQLSARGGELECEVKDGRVLISGGAVTYLAGEIYLD